MGARCHVDCVRMAFRRVARVVVIVCFVVAITGLVAEAVVQIRQGNGAGVYFNVYGQQIHWTSVIVMLVSTGVALLVAVVMRWWHQQQERKLERLVRRGGRHE